MPKPKKSQNNQSNLIPTIAQLISDYDRVTLIKELDYLQNGIGWKVLKAALIKEYQDKVAYQMDLCSKTGKHVEAAFESGCAQTMLDIATVLIEKYKHELSSVTSKVLIPEVRPEE